MSESLSTPGPSRKIVAQWLSDPATQTVFDVLERAGYGARAVGGIVRNSLLGLSASDIDIATDAPPSETMRLAQAAGLKVIPTGLSHGTVSVIAGATPFEITTLRRDVATDGRHADVVFTTDWAHDAARRDFTINALYCRRDGTIDDPLGGLRDLFPTVRVRFIGDGDRRISEDYLRILRFFRFSAVYATQGWLDPAGVEACRRGRNGLARISGERIQSELRKLLCAAHAVPAVRSMIACGVYSALFSSAPAFDRFQRLSAIETGLGRTPDPMLRLAALSVTGPDSARQLDRRLKLPVADRVRLLAAPSRLGAVEGSAGGRGLAAIDDAAMRALAYRLGAPGFNDGLLLAWAASGASETDPVLSALVGKSDSWTAPVFELTGEDVLAMGISPGPEVGALLSAVEAQWIETDFRLPRSGLLECLSELISKRQAAGQSS
jgi:poly(A) polymerase